MGEVVIYGPFATLTVRPWTFSPSPVVSSLGPSIFHSPPGQFRFK